MDSTTRLIFRLLFRRMRNAFKGPAHQDQALDESEETEPEEDLDVSCPPLSEINRRLAKIGVEVEADYVTDVNYTPSETWREALTRYQRFSDFCKTELSDVEYLGHDLSLKYQPPSQAEALEQIRHRIGLQFPAVLVDLYTTQGAFELDGWSVKLFPPTEILKNLTTPEGRYGHWKTLGLAEVAGFYTNPEEFKTVLSAEQYAFINAHYHCFGFQSINDSDSYFFYFDQAGNFGVVEYDHDWFHFNGEAWRNEYFPLLEQSPARLSLDQLISQAINRRINQLKDYIRETVADYHEQ